MIFAFTVAACCSPSEPADTCMVPSAGDTDSDQGMDAMAMSTEACPLVKLTKNDPDPPLYPYIGSAHWHVPWAQDYFDQGLRFYFAFNNRESYRAFRKAAHEAEDNRIPCSACYWAQALVLGVDLNMPKELEPDREAANDALRHASKENPSPEDWEIIQALFERYQDCNKSDSARRCQNIRNLAYYDGMTRVLKEFGSDDPNLITLFADSAMNITPWAYWKDGNPVDGRIVETQNYLKKALSIVQYPRNEGPIHWYIHLMEQSRTPDAAKEYADLLAPLAPNAGHLVHMPSHIYYRMGDMQNAIRANKEATEADERYFATEPDLYRPDGDRYRYGYYLHNINFVLAAAALSGDKDQDIDRYSEKLLRSLPDKANGFRADVYRSAYYLAKINFSSTSGIRKFPPPNPIAQQPLANIAYDFAQLMADIWDGNNSKPAIDKLDADVAKYRRYASDQGKQNASCDIGLNPPKPELCLAAILSNLGHARVEASRANWEAAVADADRAVKVQDALPYDEPPLWPYPARQTQASILIRKAIAEGPTTPPGAKDLGTAKDLLLKSLNAGRGDDPGQIPTGTYPGNGWAYYGLLEIATRDGSPENVVNNARADLVNHWFGAAEFQQLDRL
ncbi:hypothetical protein [Mycobacterium bohemicum]|nr:hypothetical protein [Mycobacterium bohemicum]MCV6969810.1 hypothetical protein [Mycobacterium bohemicum]